MAERNKTREKLPNIKNHVVKQPEKSPATCPTRQSAVITHLACVETNFRRLSFFATQIVVFGKSGRYRSRRGVSEC